MKIFKKAAAFALAALFVFFAASSATMFVSGDEYNDAWLLEYENIREKDGLAYTVPTLFKNDRAFGNHHSFPLVVQNNIHYVPMEMFSGLSGIRVNSGYSLTNFYITNEKQKRYISFDVENGLVTTHDFESYKLETKLFYDTRYLPAKEVAKVLGVTMEIYENVEESVYALRFSDTKAKLSFAELIKMYMPIKKVPDPPVSETVPDVVPDGTDIVVDPPAPPISEQPEIPEMGERSIYISFDVGSFANLADILRVCERKELVCTFFVSPGDITAHPDEIRQIIAYGQNIGFLLDPNMPRESLAEAKENLKLVSKRSTRIVRFSGGSRRVSLSDEEYSSFVGENGLVVWDWNLSYYDTRALYDNIYNGLYAMSGIYGAATAVIRIFPGVNTASALENLAELEESKNQLSFAVWDETTPPEAYRAD